MYEYNVYIPSLETCIYMQEGDGSQLDAIDYANGLDGYIDYEIQSGKNAGDGGIFMFNVEQNKNDDWRNLIPEAIKFALDLDECPEYELKEVA